MPGKTRYIWGFPGIGKSNASLSYSFVDADCERFKFELPPSAEASLHAKDVRDGVLQNPEYPSNYLNFLNGLDVDVAFINCHINLLEHFEKENLILVYPSEQLREEYLQRYISRGDNPSFVAYMSEAFTGMVEYIRQSPFRKIKIQEPGIYLSDLLNGGNSLMSQFITKDALTELFSEARNLGVYSPPEPYGTQCPAAELAQLCFEGAFEVDISKLEADLASKKAEIKLEQEKTQRRGGLGREELKDKLLQGIVNGALSIHHGQIAPYSYGFEVKYRDESNTLIHRWECYCSFEDVADKIVNKIENARLDRTVGSNEKLQFVDVAALVAAIDEKEKTKITSFVEASKSGLEPRGRYTGHVANLRDVHTGVALDGIIRGKYQGDYSSITTCAQNDTMRALVAMKGFCLDCINQISNRPLQNFIVDYLRKHGTDISTPEKLRAWIDANPDKCGMPENRSRKPSLNSKVASAADRSGQTPCSRNVSKEKTPERG